MGHVLHKEMVNAGHPRSLEISGRVDVPGIDLAAQFSSQQLSSDLNNFNRRAAAPKNRFHQEFPPGFVDAGDAQWHKDPGSKERA